MYVNTKTPWVTKYFFQPNTNIVFSVKLVKLKSECSIEGICINSL